MIDRVRDLLVRFRRAALVAGVALLVLWVTFLDSHSLVRRVKWHREAEELRQANIELRAEIEHLKSELAKDLTDEQIEQIAREQYGMQREGETVHPVQPKN
ncbi:MAG: cell division protein FtsB [Rhodothermales bacterium]|jgi:cell division protein FtsB